MLKRSRWLLLKRPEKLTGEQRGRLAELVRRNLRTVRAYLLKEDFQSLWGYVSPYWAGQFLDRWCTRTMRSRLDPMKEVARMVALAPRPVSELVPSPGAVLQWRCRRLQRKGQSDHQTGVWVPHLRGTGSRFVSRTWRPARTKTHPQILLTRRIWNVAAEQFPGAIEIVDIYHAKQHLCDVAKALYGPGTDLAQQWAKDRRAELDAGRLRALVAALRIHVETTPEARKRIYYVFGNRHRMRYPKFRAKGLCISSGVVEAGCKQIGARLKRAGMRWTVAGANAIIALRCCILSGRFEDFWERRAANAA